MPKLILLTLVMALIVTPCYGVKLSEVKKILMENGQQDYFPANGIYKALPDICDKDKCFSIVTVDYVTKNLHGMHRLAIFSLGKYLGCYSGLDELPIGVKGSKLIFKRSEYGDTVEFKGTEPPRSIWIDGTVYEFDPAL